MLLLGVLGFFISFTILIFVFSSIWVSFSNSCLSKRFNRFLDSCWLKIDGWFE